MEKEQLKEMLCMASIVGGGIAGLVIGGLIAGHGTETVVREYVTEALPYARYTVAGLVGICGATFGSVIGAGIGLYLPEYFEKTEENDETAVL